MITLVLPFFLLLPPQIFEKRSDPRGWDDEGTQRMYPMSISSRSAAAIAAAGAHPSFMAPEREPLKAWLINGKPWAGMQVTGDAATQERLKVSRQQAGRGGGGDVGEASSDQCHASSVARSSASLRACTRRMALSKAISGWSSIPYCMRRVIHGGEGRKQRLTGRG